MGQQNQTLTLTLDFDGKRVTGGIKDSAGEIVKFGNASVDANKKLDDLGDTVEKVDKKADKGGSSILKFAKRLGILGGVVSILGAGLAAFSIANVLELTEELADLQNGTKNVEDLSAAAQGLNQHLSTLEVSRLIAINEQFGKQKGKLSALSGEITNQLSPFLHGLLGNLEDVENSFISWISTGDKVTNAVISGMGYVIDIITAVRAVLKLAQVGYLTLGEKGTGALVQLGEAGAIVADQSLGQIVRTSGMVIKSFQKMLELGAAINQLTAPVIAAQMRAAAASVGNTADEWLAYRVTVKGIQDLHADFSQDLKQAKKELAALEGEVGKGSDKAKSIYNEWSASLDKVAKSQERTREALKKQKDAEKATRDSAKKSAKAARDKAKADREVKKALKAQQKAQKDNLKIGEKLANAMLKEMNLQIDARNQVTLTANEYYKAGLRAQEFTEDIIDQMAAFKAQTEQLKKYKELYDDFQSQHLELDFQINVQDGSLTEDEQKIATDKAAVAFEQAKLKAEGYNAKIVDMAGKELTAIQIKQRLADQQKKVADIVRDANLAILDNYNKATMLPGAYREWQLTSKGVDEAVAKNIVSLGAANDAINKQQDFYGSLADGLENSTGTMEDRLKSFADQVIREFERIYVWKPLLDSIFGEKTASGGRTGGLAASVFEGLFAKSSFGVGGSASTASLAGSFGGFRATGGDVYAGLRYVIGERGSEEFVPQVNGRIIPNDAQSGGVAKLHITHENIQGQTTEIESAEQDENGVINIQMFTEKVKADIYSESARGKGLANLFEPKRLSR